MSNSLRDNLGSFADRYNIARSLGAAAVVGAANSCAADRYRALSYKDGRLTIGVSTQGERYLLQSKLNDIGHAVNERLGREVVREVRIRVQTT